MRCTISELIPTAISHGKAEASGGRWKAVKHSIADRAYVMVDHHNTHMLTYDIDPQIVRPVSAGWGSATDKQGINKVLRGIGSSLRYDSLYGDSDRVDIPKHEPEPEPITRFEPPIKATDHYGM